MPDKAFETLCAISDLLALSGSETERLSDIFMMLESRMRMRRITLLLLSASGEEFVFHSTTNSQEHLSEPIHYRRGEGIIGQVLQTGRPVVVPCIANAPDFRNRIHQREPKDARQHSFICIPILFGTEIFGALAADVPHNAEENLENTTRFLRVVAGMIAHDVKLRRTSLLKNRALQAENLRLMTQFGNLQLGNLVGGSDKMRTVYQRISQVAPGETNVLVRGESGTGKELAASAIHYNSPRAEKPFIKVNCAALNENLLESELFGHEKGAFTGAVVPRIGRVEEAEGGTLFLDEIGDFTQPIQIKLLRLLQEREYTVVGSNTVRKANVRFVTATNRNLEQAVESGAFRQDLYYRINVFPIFLPPLRERREDILPLANHFIEKYAALSGKDVRRISTTAIDMLMAYHWPGNVRELENCIQHGVVVCQGASISGFDLPPTLAMPDTATIAPRGSMPDRIAQLERDMLCDALKRTRGNITAAARELGITPRMARYKTEKLDIDITHLTGGL